MPRSARTDVSTLVQEVRAMELLANEVEPPVNRIEAYWAVSADLITLASDVEILAIEDPEATNDDSRLLSLRRRLRVIGANLAELSLE